MLLYCYYFAATGAKNHECRHTGTVSLEQETAKNHKNEPCRPRKNILSADYEYIKKPFTAYYYELVKNAEGCIET